MIVVQSPELSPGQAVLLSLPSGERISLTGAPNISGFLKQQSWWIDQRNVTGLAKNSNTGQTRFDPLRSWNGAGGIIDRFGGTSFPLLSAGPSSGPQGVGFNFLSGSPTDGSDPITFRPTQAVQTVVRFNGLLDAHNLVSTGALAGVIPKNRATGTNLSANLSSVPGAAVGQLLVNTTRGARSIVNANLGGGVFELCQPQTIINNFPVDGAPTPIDTYANGDAFQLYNLDQLDMVRLESDVAEWEPNFTAQYITMTALGIMLPNVVGTQPFSNFFYIGDHVALVNCWAQKRLLLSRPLLDRPVNIEGCLCSGGIKSSMLDVAGVTTSLAIDGGAVANGVLVLNTAIDQDCILDAGTLRMRGGQASLIMLKSGTTLEIDEECIVTDNGNGVAIWGAGALAVHGRGRIFLEGTTAVSSFLQTGGLTINGQSSAFSASRANPSVINGNVAITNANIDANASGLWVPGGGAIANFG
jgi:hypothetical protein